MPGYQFKMTTATIAVERPDDMTVFQVPAGASVTVLGQLLGNRLVDVNWEGRSVMMFGRDLHEHAERII
ncbi:MAG: hypothetical protein ABSB35_28945 [Bryobacteraceae bacterium]|jgi:hypothetical protein